MIFTIIIKIWILNEYEKNYNYIIFLSVQRATIDELCVMFSNNFEKLKKCKTI